MFNKIVYLKAYFGEIGAKLTIFLESLTLILFISTNFWANFGLFEAFSKLRVAKFGLLNVFGPSNFAVKGFLQC